MMQKNPDIGAACGRIHPTGSGYMQWYQKFEYAVGQSLRVFQANNLLTTHESLGIVSKYKIFSLECLQIEFILIE